MSQSLRHATSRPMNTVAFTSLSLLNEVEHQVLEMIRNEKNEKRRREKEKCEQKNQIRDDFFVLNFSGRRGILQLGLQRCKGMQLGFQRYKGMQHL